MALLAVGQLHVQLFKFRLCRCLALLQILELGIYLAQISAQLLGPCAGLIGQLRQAQRFDLQLMRALRAFLRLAPRAHQALRAIVVSRFCLELPIAAFFQNQGLRAQLLVDVFNLLRPSEQACLLRILRIKAHAVRAHAMPALDVNHLARLQLVARSQGVFNGVGGVAAMQPSAQQGLQPRIMNAQQIQQLGQAARLISGSASQGQRVKSQFRGRRILREGANRLQPPHFQAAHPLAQRRLQRLLPALLDMQLGPQRGQAV